MRINAKTTREQLAAIVVEKLNEHGISAVLVGGAVVSIYTKNKYESYDLDFISAADQSDIKAAMQKLGFKSQGKEFVHTKTEFTVEFPVGPISLGNEEPIIPEGELKIGKVKIKLLSPTQSVMDRLVWFYHYNDRQCLDQAVLVAQSQDINIKKIEAWSEREGAGKRFEVFMKRIKKT